MSADNGIYVAKWPDGWRVGEYFASDESNDPAWVREVFGGSRIYSTRADALLAAHDIAAECSVLEYGVSVFLDPILIPMNEADGPSIVEPVHDEPEAA